MNTKEFIEQVISGELGKNDVLEFASHVKRDYNGDIQALTDDLFLLAHGALLYGRTQAVSDSEEIDRLEKAASVISEAYGLDSMTAAEPGTDPEQEAEEKRSANDQFSTNKNTEEMEKIFNNLKDAGFIDKGTLLTQWRAICGFTKRGDTQKINWLKQNQGLAYFTDTIWGINNWNTLWVILQNCFTIKGCDIENTNSIKQQASKMRGLTDDQRKRKSEIKILDSIIMGTYQNSQDSKQ